MTLRHFKIFLTVYQTQSMTLAAERLHLTQPAVTRAIKEIERHYGVRLFERLNRRLYVTESGRRLYARALHLTEAFDALEKELGNGDTFGVLRIGATMTLGSFLLPDLVSLFQKQLPRIQVQATVLNRGALQKMLLDNRLDLALIEGGVDDPRLHGEAFGGDRLILIAPPGHPLLQGASLGDLVKYPLLLREKDSSVRIFLEQLFAVEGLPPLSPQWESASTQAIIRAVGCGLGVSLLPEQLVHRDILLGTVCPCPVKDAQLHRPYCIAWDRHKFLTEAAQAFISLCKDRGGAFGPQPF